MMIDNCSETASKSFQSFSRLTQYILKMKTETACSFLKKFYINLSLVGKHVLQNTPVSFKYADFNNNYK